MTLSTQKNGPASPASDPSRGSTNSPKGKAMNASVDTTRLATAAMIKLPHANTAPSHDLADALSILRVVAELMGDDRGINAEFASDINVVIQAAKERIQSVHALLDGMDLIEEYRASRIGALLHSREV